MLKHLASGKSPKQIVEELPDLDEADISDCLLYAAWLASGKAIEITPAG